jgi:DNA repair photolyase
VNAPEVLEAQLERARPGTVMVSSVTDPYQPLEERYQLTRRCLAALLQAGFPVTLLTKSPLVLRDLDLLEQFGELEVGITVTTDDEEIRAVFEPGAPPVRERIEALRRLRSRGVRTYAFIGPLLPMDPGRLSEALRDHVDYVLVDRMNYASKTARIFARMGLGRWLEPALLREVTDRLVLGFPAGRAIVL